jgi:hypothetical protein
MPGAAKSGCRVEATGQGPCPVSCAAGRTGSERQQARSSGGRQILTPGARCRRLPINVALLGARVAAACVLERFTGSRYDLRRTPVPPPGAAARLRRVAHVIQEACAQCQGTDLPKPRLSTSGLAWSMTTKRWRGLRTAAPDLLGAGLRRPSAYAEISGTTARCQGRSCRDPGIAWSRRSALNSASDSTGSAAG